MQYKLLTDGGNDLHSEEPAPFANSLEEPWGPGQYHCLVSCSWVGVGGGGGNALGIHGLSFSGP